jgi:glutamate synthase domain-containing protein 3
MPAHQYFGGDYRPIVGDYVGTGMHGGIIYLRGKVEEYQLGKEVSVKKLDKQDEVILKRYLQEYCQDLRLNLKEILNKKFTKLLPTSSRPYGNIYTY